ncbi:MAG: mechanosensitive ion channel family protein [Haloarculaceae archaeon]
MNRHVGVLSLVLAAGFGIAAGLVGTVTGLGTVGGVAVGAVAARTLAALAIALAGYGLYRITAGALADSHLTRRRQHDALNVLRLTFGVATVAALLGVLTAQWLGLLFSLGIVGFAVTFALQQPLFSLLGWVYIVLKRPYQVGDRVAIEDSKGDVVDVDFLVTTLWDINGELVSSNQPSGRTITVPNSVVLSAHVKNYTREEFPFVWNELTMQVAYETDLAYARETMAGVADEFLGDQMAERIGRYRERLAETPVELEVQDRPSVNVVQKESWVELHLRYLVDPKRGQRTRNELYRRVLEAFNDEPDRIAFPVSRNR